MIPTGREQLRRVNLIRYLLPIVLLLIVLFYESWEHLILTGAINIDIHYTSEILFFGIVGPSAVFLVLSYVAKLLMEQVNITEELEGFNQDLETRVEERTMVLAERNEELARANEELQKLDTLKSEFVALVSHELRGPLTTLNGGLELALESADSFPPEARRVVEVMAHESHRLTDFVQNILDISKLEAGKLELNLGVVAIRPLLVKSVELIWPNGNREIRWSVPSDLPPVWADESYLEKAVCNLLTNANKYSPPEEPVEISVNTSNGHMKISIVDYGAGIPVELQDRIFERFSRVEPGNNVASNGWGLGLYFARKLMEAQGGRLEVISPAHDLESTPGAGFIMVVPLAAEIPDDA